MGVTDYISGGYIVAAPVERISLGAELLPEKILSLSEELCKPVPDHNDMPWGNIPEQERFQNSNTVKVCGLSIESFQQIGV